MEFNYITYYLVVGKKFIEKFSKLPDTKLDINGTITCELNIVDDSGLYLLYGMRSVTGPVCSGLQFSKFFQNGSNIYPNAAHVYDAVYALAYGANNYLYKEEKTDLKSSSSNFYKSSFFNKVKFEGATGLVSFDQGSMYYPYNNRGDRRTGHVYEFYNFNEELYQSSNGTSGLIFVGQFQSGNGTTLCSHNENNLICGKIIFNTADGLPVTNLIVYTSFSHNLRISCIALAIFILSQAVLFTCLKFHYRNSKLFKKSLRKLCLYTVLGCILVGFRTLLTGLDNTTYYCGFKLWSGQLGFLITYGAFFRQLLIEYNHSYRNIYSSNQLKVSSFSDWSIKRSKSILPSTVDQENLSHKSCASFICQIIADLPSRCMNTIILITVCCLLLETFIGVPHFEYIITYQNLSTTYESACRYQSGLIIMIGYGLQLCFVIYGLFLAWKMRKDLGYLHESKELLISVITGICCFLILYVIAIVVAVSPASSNTDRELTATISYCIAATLGMILVCWPPIFEIISLELEGLIIHQSLLDHSCSKDELMKIIRENIDLLYKVDRVGRHAFQVALDFDISESILVELFQFFLPVDFETKQPTSPLKHRYAWLYLVQTDRNSHLVEIFMDKYANLANELAFAEDSEGRMAINIASHVCQRIIKESIYFCKRYEILTLDAPVHKSKTCVLHIALDHGNDNERVALKFMKIRDQYIREVAVRKDANIDDRYVISVIRHYSYDVHELYDQEVKRRGFDEYLYCVVMPAADRDLDAIITNEHIAGKDFAQVKSIAIEVAQALDHLHSHGIMHGDVKSKNIMRIGHKIKLIDLDASALLDGGFAGAKFSSAYAPPEIVFFREPGAYASLTPKISDKSTERNMRRSSFDRSSQNISDKLTDGKSIKQVLDDLAQKLLDMSPDRIVPSSTGTSMIPDDKPIRRSSFALSPNILDEKPTKRTSFNLSHKTSDNMTMSQKIENWKNLSNKYYEDPSNLSLRTFEVDSDGKPMVSDLLYDLVPASYSYDTWSLGVVLFELCAGIPLFLANSEDNVLVENLLDLYAFTDKYKNKRMLEIQNLEARNLVSQMLMKDPYKRPRMPQVLAHPFLTGRKAPRMLGETADFDVFISYRVQSDLEHAEMLYNKLTAAGLRVWWDKKSLSPGVPWQVIINKN